MSTPSEPDPAAPLAATLVVVTDPKQFALDLPDVAVVSARHYLTRGIYGQAKRSRVINLSRSYRYQKVGYYVSLLAQARGHRPVPHLATIQEAKSRSVIRLVSDELHDLIQAAFVEVEAARVELNVYFGKTVGGAHPQLAAAVFGRIPMPLLRLTFERNQRRDRWDLVRCAPLAPADVPPEHHPALSSALEQFLRRRTKMRTPDVGRYDLAILVDPHEAEPPSDEGAIARFEAAAEAEGFAVERIGRDDYARVAEFDALFIRETTAVNHRTFRFAQRAAAEGLVVIDDPESILRCTNKVFLAEVLQRNGIACPGTMIAHRGNLRRVEARIGYPCVLKQPDSSFSQGVVKVSNPEEFREQTGRLLQRSDLIVAQAFTPTDFDWRIGVLGRQPLYACRYYMARRHWQIIRRDGDTPGVEEGDAEAVPLDEVPKHVMRAALASANLMGDGLYGVDLKEVDGQALVIEVNDNPSIDAGYEDALLGGGLYRRIMHEMRRRVEARRPGAITEPAR